jgi:hypothetical protein
MMTIPGRPAGSQLGYSEGNWGIHIYYIGPIIYGSYSHNHITSTIYGESPVTTLRNSIIGIYLSRYNMAHDDQTLTFSVLISKSLSCVFRNIGTMTYQSVNPRPWSLNHSVASGSPPGLVVESYFESSPAPACFK